MENKKGREVRLAARRRAGEGTLIVKWGGGRCTISKTIFLCWLAT